MTISHPTVGRDDAPENAPEPAIPHAALTWSPREADRPMRDALARAAAPGAVAGDGCRVLARARALRAHVEARRAGILRLHARPRVLAAPVPLAPGRALADATAEGAAPLLDLAAAAGPGRALWDQPCTDWVALPPGVPRGRYVALSIHGDSMTPLLASGDTVLVRLDPEPRRGAVIVARHPEDGYLCKRVGALTARRVVLESLAPDHPPRTIPRDPALVLGPVVCAWGRDAG